MWPFVRQLEWAQWQSILKRLAAITADVNEIQKSV
jgi:hypothetical protein